MKNKLIVFLLMFFKLNSLYAQPENFDSLSTMIYKNGYQLIDQYELLSHLKSDTDYTKFQKLFRDKNTLIFNDIMPDNKLSEKITPHEYIQLTKKYYSNNIGVSIIPTDKSSISFDRDDYGSFVFHAQKIIDVYTKTGIHYNDTFNIRIEIFFNHYLNKYWISDIHSLDKNEKYIVVQPIVKSLFSTRSLLNDTVFTSAGEKFAVEPNGYFLIKDVPSAKQFVFIPKSNQVLFKRYTSPTYLSIIKKHNRIDQNIIAIKFWKWTSHIDFTTEFGIVKNSPVSIVDNTNKINVINKLSTSNQILFSLMYRNSAAGNWQIKFGLGFDIFNYDLYMPKCINTYPSIDPDGDPYLRIIELNNLKESNSLTYLTFPLILQKNFSVNNSSVNISAGYYFMKSYDATYASNATAIYSGFYDYLFNLTISENGVYDFGYYEVSTIATPLLTNSLISAFGFGCQYSYNISRFTSLNIGINYRKSSDFLFKENPNRLSNNSNELRSLSNISNSFQIRYTSLQFGIKVKI